MSGINNHPSNAQSQLLGQGQLLVFAEGSSDGTDGGGLFFPGHIHDQAKGIFQEKDLVAFDAFYIQNQTNGGGVVLADPGAPKQTVLNG